MHRLVPDKHGVGRIRAILVPLYQTEEAAIKDAIVQYCGAYVAIMPGSSKDTEKGLTKILTMIRIKEDCLKESLVSISLAMADLKDMEQFEVHPALEATQKQLDHKNRVFAGLEKREFTANDLLDACLLDDL